MFFDAAGIPLALLCLYEPFVLKNICGRKNSKFANESLGNFLNSAMNIEYVCLILTGITQLSHNDTAQTAFGREEITKPKESNNESSKKIKIKDFKIDKELWDVNSSENTITRMSSISFDI